MRDMISALIASLVLVVLTAQLPASDYYDGYTTSDGYVYHTGDGYWWKNGVAYTRTLYTHTSPGYYTTSTYCNGYCTQVYHAGSSYDYWVYNAANYTPPVAVAKTIPYTPDWKDHVIEAVKQRDDLNAYLQTMKLLGLPLPPDQGAVPIGTYMQSGYNGNYGNYNLGAFGTNATTVWGYNSNQSYANVSVADAAKVFDRANLGVLFQALGRTTEQAQKYAGQAHDNLVDITKLAVDGDSRMAEIIAKGIAAKAALEAAAGPNVVHTQSSTGVNQTAPPGPLTPIQPPAPPVVPLAPQPQPPPMPPAADASVPQAWRASALMRCSGCHSGPNPKAGFDVASYASMSLEEREKRVWPRIDPNASADKRMPRKADGVADVPLPANERALWYALPVLAVATDDKKPNS